MLMFVLQTIVIYALCASARINRLIYAAGAGAGAGAAAVDVLHAKDSSRSSAGAHWRQFM